MMSAPASVRLLLGGSGDQRSSHISMPNFSPSYVVNTLGSGVMVMGLPAM